MNLVERWIADESQPRGLAVHAEHVDYAILPYAPAVLQCQVETRQRRRSHAHGARRIHQVAPATGEGSTSSRSTSRRVGAGFAAIEPHTHSDLRGLADEHGEPAPTLDEATTPHVVLRVECAKHDGRRVAAPWMPQTSYACRRQTLRALRPRSPR
jgi:hypothetical protein